MITVENTGAVADTFSLAVSGGMPGWTASLDQTTIALDSHQSGTVVLTVVAPGNLPEGLPVSHNVAATSQSSSAVSATASVTTFTNPPPPSSGNATQTSITAGNGVSASVADNIILAATVRDLTAGLAVTGPGKGTVTFFVAGIPVGAAFAGDDLYLPSSISPAFDIVKETAALEYTGDSLVSTSSTAAGTTSNVNLSAAIREQVDGNIGDRLATTQLRFSVYRAGDPAQTVIASCTAAVSQFAAGAGVAACSVNLPAGNYVAKVELVDNGFYAAPPETQPVIVAQPSNAFTTGGGWLAEPNDGPRSNFGFNAKYRNNGTIQGNSLYIRRVSADIGYDVRDYNWKIQSTRLIGLAQRCTTAAPTYCSATVTGIADITAIDVLTEQSYTIGTNYRFQLDVSDRAEPGSTPGNGPDSYAMRVWTQIGSYYVLGGYQGTVNSTQVAIGGGNIQVHRQ